MRLIETPSFSVKLGQTLEVNCVPRFTHNVFMDSKIRKDMVKDEFSSFKGGGQARQSDNHDYGVTSGAWEVRDKVDGDVGPGTLT